MANKTTVTMKKGSTQINVDAARIGHYKKFGYEPVEAKASGKKAGEGLNNKE